MSDSEDIFNNNEGVGESSKKRNRKAPPKISFNWTGEDTEKLISEVEVNGCLWDARLKENHDLVKRNAAWRTISEKSFNGAISSDQLKVKWQALTCTYREKQKQSKTKKSGQATQPPIRWRWWTAMQFLTAAKDDYAVQSESNLVRFFTFQLGRIMSMSLNNYYFNS